MQRLGDVKNETEHVFAELFETRGGWNANAFNQI